MPCIEYAGHFFFMDSPVKPGNDGSQEKGLFLFVVFSFFCDIIK